jgi:ParB/RepB/Spo0J family partition protein
VDHEFNCRGELSAVDCADLARDIEAKGLLQPVVLSQLDQDTAAKTGKKYRLLAGFRRCFAHTILKRDSILAIIRSDVVSETEARVINLTENLHRKELNIFQEAKAIEHLFRLGLSEALISERLGQPRGWVQIRHMLLRLPEPVQHEVKVGTIKQTSIRELYTIHRTGNSEALNEVVRKVKDDNIKGNTKPRSLLPMAMKKQQKVVQPRGDVEGMCIYLVNCKLQGLATKCLAWASGNISLDDLFKAIKAEAETRGVPWHEPSSEEYAEMSKP